VGHVGTKSTGTKQRLEESFKKELPNPGHLNKTAKLLWRQQPQDGEENPIAKPGEFPKAHRPTVWCGGMAASVAAWAHPVPIAAE
jgi:hypothetical protein